MRHIFGHEEGKAERSVERIMLHLHVHGVPSCAGPETLHVVTEDFCGCLSLFGKMSDCNTTRLRDRQPRHRNYISTAGKPFFSSPQLLGQFRNPSVFLFHSCWLIYAPSLKRQQHEANPDTQIHGNLYPHPHMSSWCNA